MRVEERGRRLGLALADARAVDRLVALVRLIAVPFAVVEVAVERGAYPPGHEAWAWALAAVFAAGALLLFALARRVAGARGLAPAALAFDVTLVSGWVVLYAFEPGTPVRQLLLLPVLEAALRYGTAGGVLFPLASVPALAGFEWRHADRFDLPFDPGHVVFPAGLQVLVGLAAGALVGALRRSRPAPRRRAR